MNVMVNLVFACAVHMIFKIFWFCFSTIISCFSYILHIIWIKTSASTTKHITCTFNSHISTSIDWFMNIEHNLNLLCIFGIAYRKNRNNILASLSYFSWCALRKKSKWNTHLASIHLIDCLREIFRRLYFSSFSAMMIVCTLDCWRCFTPKMSEWKCWF